MRIFTRTAVAAVLACSTVALARDLVVGQVVDYSGKFGEASRDYVAGAKTYFDLLNSRGGLNGMKIRFTVLDRANDAQAVRTRTRELLDEKKADVLFGYVGDEAVAAAALEPELRGGVALVAPLAGGEAPASAAPSVAFARPGYEAEVRQIVSHFRALQLTRFAVVKTAADADRSIGELVAKILVESRLTPAGVHTLSNDAGGNDADVQAVLAMKAQAIVIVSDTVPAAEFVKRYKPQDPGAMVVALSLVNHRTMFELLGPKLAHGVMITQVVPNPSRPDSPVQKEHLDAWKTFRDEPPSHLTLEGFIAAKVLIEGIRQAGSSPTRESIAAVFHKMGRVDVKGLVVDFSRQGRLSSEHVDIAMIRKNGALLQ
jgi:ABC-type branched-subunit amino acid transport system substrate-binding protein